jgi:hypothetical protein
MGILEWDKDSKAICERIRSPARLKVVVKTIESPELIEDWIKHHERIVGSENLIIADNGSLDQRVLDIYEKNSHEAIIFRFSGPHNQIHWHPRFSSLFEAIRASCEYCLFADADERLVWMSENSWTADRSLVGSLPADNGRYIVPTTWLINRLNSRTRFGLLDTEGRPRLSNNLKWGKPILPAGLVGAQSGIHNAQYGTESYSTSCGTNFILLHLTQLPMQRIVMNRKKLISNGYIENGLTDEEIISLDLDNPLAMRFIIEMKNMYSLLASGTEETSEDGSSYLELHYSGDIGYSSFEARETFRSFLNAGPDLVREVFRD